MPNRTQPENNRPSFTSSCPAVIWEANARPAPEPSERDAFHALVTTYNRGSSEVALEMYRTHLFNARDKAIADFCREVNARAEEKMLTSHKLEGMHYASMREILKERGIEL